MCARVLFWTCMLKHATCSTCVHVHVSSLHSHCPRAHPGKRRYMYWVALQGPLTRFWYCFLFSQQCRCLCLFFLTHIHCTKMAHFMSIYSNTHCYEMQQEICSAISKQFPELRICFLPRTGVRIRAGYQKQEAVHRSTL